MFFKKKNFYFLVCIFLLFFCFFSIFEGSEDIDIESVQVNRKKNENFISAVKVDSVFGMYNSDEDSYYFACQPMDVDRIKIYSPYKIKYVIKKESDNVYVAFVYSDKYYNTINIYFDNISYINISNVDISDRFVKKSYFSVAGLLDFNSDEVLDDNLYFISSSSNYFKHNYKMYDSSNYLGNVRERGGTSLYFPKKSYKIDLNSKKSMVGMNKDDDWILDALYTDFSKIRNKLSYDMWNLINDNQVINNDVNGEFVDLYFNSEYNGLYVIKEKVDKSITNVTNNGVLLKSVSYHDNDSILDIDSSDELLFDRFEIKYKSDDCFSNFIYKYINYYSDSSSYGSISDTFYIDNYVNYKIFLSLISGNDNLIKNQYWSMSNSRSKILITPWDLDLTWGLVWSDSDLYYSNFSFQNYNDVEWMNLNIYDVDDQTRLLLKDRYWELRRDVITMDTINNFLDSYKKILIDSGASSRDSEKWYEYDIDSEIENIRTWASYRIEFLDEYFK